MRTLLVGMVLALAGCAAPIPPAPEKSDTRFEVTAKQGEFLRITVLRDKQTGAEYLVVEQGRGCAITRMGN